MREDKGITIIALIITIIILLILVGVSINLAIKGDLFGSTQKAVSGTNAKVEEEQTRVDELMGNLTETVMNTCEHSITTWTGNIDGTHTATCPKCGKVFTENHTYENSICTKCNMIVFYYETNETYTAPQGMTWEKWCDSDYQPYVANPPSSFNYTYKYKKFKAIGEYQVAVAYTLSATATEMSYINYVSIDGTDGGRVSVSSTIVPGANYKYFYYCLAWDTEISVVYEDEKGKRRIKKKKIQDLKPGDEILSFDWETMKLVPNKVKYVDGEENKTHYELDKWTFDDGTVIETVHRHEFYNVEAKRFKYMDEWKIGEHAYKQDGTKPMLVAHEVISKVVKHCTIVGEKGTNYFANDLLSGDRTCPKDIEL